MLRVIGTTALCLQLYGLSVSMSDVDPASSCHVLFLGTMNDQTTLDVVVILQSCEFSYNMEHVNTENQGSAEEIPQWWGCCWCYCIGQGHWCGVWLANMYIILYTIGSMYGIYANIWGILIPYIAYMDPMGIITSYPWFCVQEKSGDWEYNPDVPDTLHETLLMLNQYIYIYIYIYISLYLLSINYI